MKKIQKLAIAGVITGISGLTLAAAVGVLEMEQYDPVNAFVDVLPFQNFSVYMSLSIGFVFGLIAFLAFLLLYDRYQYPMSTNLGMWIGALTGIIICLSTNLILNVFATHFNFVQLSLVRALTRSIIPSAMGGIVGFVAGYLFAEIGGRSLRLN